LARPAERSKWFDLIQRVVRGEPVACRYGGKEVHAEDVARAIEILLSAKDIAGETYNCYDRYVSEYDVATLAQRLTQSESRIDGQPKQPVHNIETGKLQRLGMQFGGDSLLEKTVRELIERM
jgi:nucleoside-diphosphate-sugar epimerase